MAWQSGKPSPTIKPETQTTIDSIENWLAQSREVKPTGKEYWQTQKQTAVKVAEKVKKVETAKVAHRLKLKAVYKTAKPKPKPKPKVPEVKKSVFPGIVTTKKIAVATVTAIPAREFGRMTSAAIAKYYGTETVDAVAVTSRTIQEALKAMDIPDPIVREMARVGVNTYIKAYQRGLPASAIKAKVSEAIREVAKPRLAPMPLTATKTATVIKTAIATIMKPPIKPIKPPKIKPTFPPIIPPSEMSDKDKRRRILQSKGAIAFRMGELGKERDVWYTYIDPYQKPEDKIILVGKTPKGAKVVRGPLSAIRTAQLLYGITIPRKMMDDVGFMDAVFEPIDKRGIKLSFTPDPKGLTTGDFGISKRVAIEAVSKRVFPLKKEKT